jgi:hypothetical protein
MTWIIGFSSVGPQVNERLLHSRRSPKAMLRLPLGRSAASGNGTHGPERAELVDQPLARRGASQLERLAGWHFTFDRAARLVLERAASPPVALVFAPPIEKAAPYRGSGTTSLGVIIVAQCRFRGSSGTDSDGGAASSGTSRYRSATQ